MSSSALTARLLSSRSPNALREPEMSNWIVLIAIAAAMLLSFLIVAGTTIAILRRKRLAAAPLSGSPVRSSAAPTTPARGPAAVPAPPPVQPAPVPRPSPPPPPHGDQIPSATVVDLEAPAEPTLIVDAMPTLTCISGPLEGQKFPVADDGITFGRDAKRVNVRIEDGRVSGLHLWVGRRGDHVVAVDKGSTNGTFLNDMSIPRISEVTLRAGDVLILSNDVIRLRYDG